MYGEDSSGEVTGRRRVQMACGTEPSIQDSQRGVMQENLESHPSSLIWFNQERGIHLL